MKTNTRISFGVFDVTAKEDSTLNANDIQNFSDLNDLKAEDGANSPLVGTLEEDYFLLDGSFEEFPDNPTDYAWGLFSKSLSDQNGNFEEPPTLTVVFSLPHSSAGVTLDFDSLAGDYPKEIVAQWYDAVGNLLSQKTFLPNASRYFLDNKVENYQRLVVAFHSTNKPYRYLKLRNIIYGVEKILTGTDIISATVLEELDPTSSEVGINTLQCKIFSRDDEFSLLNPQGIFSALQERQPLVVEEIVDGNVIPMGTYYLDEWNNAEESSVDLSAVDLLGLIDKTNFIGGMFEEIAAGDLVDRIMLSADVPYTMDESLRGIPVRGYLPICTHREALQQVAFAIGAIVDTSRSNEIRICPMPSRPSSYIRKSRKFSGGNIRLRSLVTGVDVGAREYLPEANSFELFSPTLPVGTHTIVFDRPMYSVDVSGAEIIEFNANRVIIEVSEEGIVTIQGVGYAESVQTVSVRTPNLTSNISPNILSTDGATLVSIYNAANVARSLYDYHQKRFENEFEMIASGELVGDTVIVESLRGEKLKGTIESMETNLTGGFVSRIKVVGVRIPTSHNYFAGEIYAGDKFGVM